jgi:hypothetical protein
MAQLDRFTLIGPDKRWAQAIVRGESWIFPSFKSHLAREDGSTGDREAGLSLARLAGRVKLSC